jgi:UDP-N-acetylglucosamine acyltransferase
MPRVHPTSIIDPGARLAESVEVGPYCVVGPGVTIGEECVLESHVVIPSRTQLGRNNRLHAFSVVGDDPQDLKFRGEPTTLVVGDHNIIREHVTIHRGTGNGGGVTTIGSHNLLMVGSHVAHDCALGSHIILANECMLAGHVVIEDGAIVSGGVGIHHYATIGTCSFIGGLARISKDVPPYMVVEGNPAEVRKPNKIGMERRGYSEEDVEAIREAFKRLFRDSNGRDGGNGATTMSERMVVLRQDYPSCGPIRRLCDSLDASARGIHGRSRELSRSDDKRALRLGSLDDDD